MNLDSFFYRLFVLSTVVINFAMRFADIEGLEACKNILVQAKKNNHLAHAQCFFGEPGGGHLQMAWAYAAYVCCTNPNQEDSCGRCSSCLRFKKLIYPDLHFVFPTTLATKVKNNEARKLKKREDFTSAALMPEWREILTENPFCTLTDWAYFLGGDNKQLGISVAESRFCIKTLSLKAYENSYKVLILWLPELMNPAAANALLKILEEPPAKTLFLLVSNQIDMVLPTILSRCQIIHIPKFSEEEVQSILMRKDFTTEKALYAAQLANGNVSEAFKLVMEIKDDSQELFADWMRDCFRHDYGKLLQTATSFDDLTREAQKNFLHFSLNVFRNALMASLDIHQLIQVSESQKQFVTNFAKALPPQNMERILAAINETYHYIERNANPKIVFLDLSLEMANLIKPVLPNIFPAPVGQRI